MTEEEFAQTVAKDPALARPLKVAAVALKADHRGPGMVESAALILLFPVAKYVVVNIGLPWLYEAGRYTELWRQKFHDWVNSQYSKHNLDPEEVERAGEALRQQLEKTIDVDARKSWERLAATLAGG